MNDRLLPIPWASSWNFGEAEEPRRRQQVWGHQHDSIHDAGCSERSRRLIRLAAMSSWIPAHGAHALKDTQ